jgi:hypothetical protein
MPTTGVLVGHNGTIKVGSFRTGDVPGITTASYFSTAEPSVIPYGSPGVLQLAGGPITTYRPVSGAASFTFSGAFLSSDINVTRNGSVVSAQNLSVTASSLSVTGLTDGQNNLEIEGLDSQSRLFAFGETVWAGSRPLNVSVLSRQTGFALPGASVSVRHPAGGATTIVTGPSGTASFASVPATLPVQVEVVLAGYRRDVREWPASGSSLSYAVHLDLDDEDFTAGSGGLAGWTYDGRVFTSDHSEAPRPWIPCPGCVPRLGVTTQGVAQGPAVIGQNVDLILSNLDRPPAAISTAQRRLRVAPGARDVRVRYRVASWEAVTGQYVADWFRVRIESAAPQVRVVEDLRTVPQLTFNAQGTTAWMEIALPVLQPSEDFVVTAHVANAVDAAFETYVEIDFVQDPAPRVENVTLHDVRHLPDGAVLPLDYLSMSVHTYANNRTRVFGTIRLSGPQNDSVASLGLELVNGAGQVVATGTLAPEAAPTLVGIPFSTTGPAVVTSGPLFDFAASAFQSISQNSDEEYTLRVVGMTTGGFTIRPLHSPRRAQKLVLYTGRRAGIPDASDCMMTPTQFQPPRTPCFGDQWTRAAIKKLALDVQGLQDGAATITVDYRDFANMNGGAFPPHETHGHGTAIDVTVQGYPAVDRQAGRRIILFAQALHTAMPAGWSLGNICADFLVHEGQTSSVLRDYIVERSGVGGDLIGPRTPLQVFRDCDPARHDHHTHIHVGLVRTP